MRVLAAIASAAVALTGCPAHPPECHGDDEPASGFLFQDPAADPAAPGVGVLRPLTPEQYDAALAALLPGAPLPGASFPLPEYEAGFEAVPAFDLVRFEHLLVAAEDAAAFATTDPAALLRCDPDADGERACVSSWLGTFLRRAFRRPVSAADVTHFLGFFDERRTTDTLAEALAATVTAILVHPDFLYVHEGYDALAAGGTTAVLSDVELATRLSFALAVRPPDDALLDAAERGDLSDDAGLSRELDRLLGDGSAGVRSFFRQLLRLDRLDTLDRHEVWIYGPNGAPADPLLGPSARAETERFIEAVLDGERPTLRELLTADYSYVDDRIARLYGVESSGSPDFARIDTGPGRSGFLTHPGLLMLGASNARTSPTRRGLLIRERLLCQPVAAPPMNVTGDLSTQGTAVSVPDALSRHASDPSCVACHRLMDPIGLAFEQFDTFGRLGTTPGGAGTLTGAGTVDGDFGSVPELGEKLATSPVAQACLVKQWVRYVNRRREAASETTSIEALTAAFQADQGRIPGLVRAAATSSLARAGRPPVP